MASRPDWSRPLPRALTIPGVMKLRTLADVRDLLRHIPADRRKLSMWQHVARSLNEAAVGGDPADVSIALRMVLFLERVPLR